MALIASVFVQCSVHSNNYTILENVTEITSGNTFDATNEKTTKISSDSTVTTSTDGDTGKCSFIETETGAIFDTGNPYVTNMRKEFISGIF